MDHLETTVDLQHLLLDPNNYRFQDEPKFLFADEKRFHESSVQDRAFVRIRGEGISDLKSSILTERLSAIRKNRRKAIWSQD